jgi:BCD family chlorophyll transporter-like MFS transporter
MKNLSRWFQHLLYAPLLWIIRLLRPVGKWFDTHPTALWWAKIFRLGLIQFGIGLSLAPISGALNRVLINELEIPAVAVGFLIALHYFISPVRAIIGYRSDKARSGGVWRTPYVVFGVMLTFAGLTCAPFALILLSGDGTIAFIPAMLICTAIFVAYGAGINILETVYLALVSDITPPKSRGKVIAVLWIMLVLGTVVSAVIVGAMLHEYSHKLLIQVMQGSALVFVLLTVVALWGQERLRPDGSIISELRIVRVRLTLWESIKKLSGQRALQALFGIIFVATLAFATHDILLEPYGGQVLNMSVSETMELTALWGMMTIVGVALAAYLLYRQQPLALLLGLGCIVGLLGFALISYSSFALNINVFRLGVSLISIGRGVFIVGSVILVMSLVDVNHAGLFLGLWGIVQAMGQGIGVVGSGLVRDVVQWQTGSVQNGYTFVYMTSLVLLAGVVLVLVFHLGQQLRVDEIRMPWDGAEEIPADQLVF